LSDRPIANPKSKRVIAASNLKMFLTGSSILLPNANR
jgi:hypothetical protein